MRRVKISGTGMFVPPKIVTNHDLEKSMETSDEWIRERSGIHERRFVEDGVAGTELGLEASKNALDAANLKPEDIDMIISSTLSPDYYFPGNSVLLQDALGLKTTPAMDVRVQCSSFIYSMNLAQLFVGSGQYDRVLVCGAEVHSRIFDYTTRGRNVACLFGDGAGAAIFEPCEDENRGVISCHLHAEGSHATDLYTKIPSARQSPTFITHENIDSAEIYTHMDGRLVYKNAVSRICQVVKEALKANSIAPEEVDHFVFHQANQRINDAVTRHLEVPEEKVHANIHKYGNCSAASIPILLDEVVREGKIKKGDLVCFAAFGSGFTWACGLMRW